MTRSLFARNNLGEHLLRGNIGAGALAYAIHISGSHPWLALALGVIMLTAFRGCPIYWTIGLFETLWRRFTKKVRR